MAYAKGPGNKYAWTVTVGEKGQIVIPKQARELFGINPGDTLKRESQFRRNRRSAGSPGASSAARRAVMRNEPAVGFGTDEKISVLHA